MALSVPTIFDTMVRQFTTSASSVRFNSDFVDAFNLVLDDLWATGALDAKIAHIASQEETVSGLEDDRHRSIVFDGLRYHLAVLGQKHANMDIVTLTTNWEKAQSKFVEMEQRAWQEDSVDSDGDPENDVIGLGRTKQ